MISIRLITKTISHYDSKRCHIITKVGIIALLTPAHAALASSDNHDVQELMRLVKIQSQQIHELQTRLSKVEKHPGIRSDTTGMKVVHKSPAYHSHHSIQDGPIEPVKFAGDEIPSAQKENVTYPLKPAPPGTYAAVSDIPNNASPVMGVTSRIPSYSSTTSIGGLVLKWGQGLPTFATPDDAYSFKVRGRVLADYGATFGSRYRDLNISRTIMRAARIGVEGHARQLSWVFEADFADNKPEVMSAFMMWSQKVQKKTLDFALGNVFNERGFDGSTGSAQTVFLDRDLVATTILPARGWYGVGGMFKAVGQNWHVAAQISGDNVNSANTTTNIRDNFTYMVRAHYIPWRNKNSLIHLGLWGFYEDVKPAANFSQKLRLLARTNDAFSMQIGPIVPISNSLAGGIEIFGIWKSSWALFEYGARHLQFRDTLPVTSPVNTSDLGKSGTTEALSAQAGIFLTGETPNYFARTGMWSSPRLLHPVIDGGWGGWELSGRWDWADSSHIPGGAQAWTATLGLNWYLLSFARLTLNYTRAQVTNKSGNYIGNNSGNSIGLRSGITF
ncbi:Phosphate-specific outer membrane porin OprP [Acetobacter malorum]|uniref:Phosphate-specific outer membrane porin OprP n=1 Tax=Acetobacter malorum TaxID=178901 RepID=A0A177G211_9PROT|nr:porin [Acetobacter malorum]OAG74449.1 Phosphate-specific outer membrane porin OprP [Acetobacter malorum]